MENVLVTGGAGYIGSTLVPLLLQQGHKVTVVDRLLFGGASLLGVLSHPNFEFIPGDVRDDEVMARSLNGKDAVVHLAAIVGDPACARQPELAREVNLEASLRVLGLAQREGVSRFLFASTCSNYGRMDGEAQLVDETSELRPISLYAETKVAVEEAVLDWGDSETFSCSVLRMATVFGVSPRMRFDLTVNEFAMEMLLNGHLVVFGEQFWRPYVHVRDVARAMSLVLDSPKHKVAGEVFNVGSTEQNYQKQQLVELIRPHAPSATIEYVNIDEDPRDYRVSFSKINEQLGFKITRTVEDGIAEVADLIRNKIITDFKNPVYRN